MFQACPTGRRPRGRPRTRWRDYVSRLAWERLGIPPEELEEVSGLLVLTSPPAVGEDSLMRLREQRVQLCKAGPTLLATVFRTVLNAALCTERKKVN
ncbi:hypothetical protein L3Q82_002482 [Scortum barcoo]|uniref:Uncharacterized protein n=1 Tax=Scortum barcoo TaxID=214431 RepID=A0ACB8VYQ5_9TELE|nr:hypothetical protein L3Q82_002482 [Scortum barcoo]